MSYITTAVSEAVTNAIVHAYPRRKGLVRLRCELDGRDVTIIVSDEGVGIRDITKARQPFYTTGEKDERSGMGFTVMEGMMDSVQVENNGEKGLKVIMRKTLQCESELTGE